MSKENDEDWYQQRDGGDWDQQRDGVARRKNIGDYWIFLVLILSLVGWVFTDIKMEALPIFILLGVVISYFSRNNAKKRKKWKSSISIVIKDYTFDDFVFINLLSLFYAIGQGGLIGASIGYLSMFLGSILRLQPNFFLLLISIACLFTVLALRVLTESVVVIFKRNSASSKWFTLHTALTLKSHPELGYGLDADEGIKGGDPGKID